MKILVRYHDGAVPLTILPQGDWIDLCAAETVTMHAGEFRIISLGVSMQLPEGYEAHIVPRSSTFRKWGILQANSMGVIDESYCGDGDVWGFPALAMRDTTIARGDRICQFRVMRKMDINRINIAIFQTLYNQSFTCSTRRRLIPNIIVQTLGCYHYQELPGYAYLLRLLPGLSA